MNIDPKTGKMRALAGKAMMIDSEGVPILDKNGKYQSYYGHHMLHADTYPEYAGDWRNIEALDYNEHYYGAHPDHKTKIPTDWYYDADSQSYYLIDSTVEVKFDEIYELRTIDSILKSDSDMKQIYNIFDDGKILSDGDHLALKNIELSINSGDYDRFSCKFTILTVPGNHDINHSSSILDVKFLKDMKYSENEIVEHKKLEAFYNFAKLNNCFKHSEMYYNIKDIDINGFKIRANLVNNAIFSTRDQYKGLLYLPNDAIDKMNEDNDADCVISIMHHAPDFYRDKIKNMMEDTIVKNSNILFHGHEHYNYSKKKLHSTEQVTQLFSLEVAYVIMEIGMIVHIL